MSYPFELGGETLWDAGYHSGQLYASVARGAAEFLEVPSGLSPSPQGGCDVELAQFETFVQALHGLYTSTGSEVLHGLTRGLLVTSLVLLERAGGVITLKPSHEAVLLAEKAALARTMA
ncbi:DUF6086 family protein [Streptomyces sp. NPDC058603]|uniref:DUF6086 family protein n=1 Tax=unclassified Streptomyces TaxID=2593676 RepID=UPI003662D358